MSIHSSRFLLLAASASLLAACTSVPTPTPVADTVAPTVSITASPNPLTTSGTVTVNVTASDDQGVAKVELYDNTVKVGEDTSAPYTFLRTYGVDSTLLHILTARAYDLSGNTADATTGVTVNLDPSEPNGSVASARPIVIGASIDGRIADSPRDEDDFSFAAKAGDQLRLTVKSQSVFPNSTLDPYVEILLPDGHTILEKDDDSGLGLESDLRFNITQDGTYYIHLTSFSIHDDPAATDNKLTNTYRLELSRR